tara:strand:- start:717 stop:1664 length:948 start_codon:yes stop_codon:yes gene_type:complete
MKNLNNNYCVVGIGNHAYSKLIPSIVRSGKRIIGIVSRSNNLYLRKYKRFKYLDHAMNVLPKNTIFVLSTPPCTHFNLIKKLVAKRKNVIVEKPIFTHPNQVDAFKKYYFKIKYSNLIYEAFMYRYTLIFKKAISFINREFNEIGKITCNFTIPSYPKDTFRDGKKIESSCLYDIGSYIFNYFITLNLRLHSFDIINTNYIDDKLSSMYFSFKIGDIDVYSNIGMNIKYENNLIIEKKDGKKINFNTFFYGRPCNKVINIINKDEIKNIVFYEKDAFTTMFKMSDKIKNLYKNKEYYKLIKINELLFEFAKKLKK